MSEWVISTANPRKLRRHYRTVHASANCSALHKRTRGSLRPNHASTTRIPADVRPWFASCTLCIPSNERWIPPQGATPEHVAAWWESVA